MKKCKVCDKEFKPWSKRSIYCSRKCSANTKKSRVTKKCESCKSEFEIIGHLAHQRFCSRKCSSDYASRTGCNKKPENKKRKISKVCETCHTEFKVWSYRKTARFCSKKCHYDYGRDKLTCTACGTNYTEEKNITANSYNATMFCPTCRERNSVSAFELNVREHITLRNISKVEYNRRVEKGTGHYIYPDMMIDNRVIVECNGDFFHCNPDRFTAEYINPKTNMTAQQTWDRDRKKVEIYHKRGYNVIVIWESEWRADREKCINRILNEIHKN